MSAALIGSTTGNDNPAAFAASAKAPSQVTTFAPRTRARNSSVVSNRSPRHRAAPGEVSYSPAYTSPRPASRTAVTLPMHPVWATASNVDTVAMGLRRISASPLIAARPTRNPVNDPGPEATAKPPMSFFENPCLASVAATCGTSCAEKVPPDKATTSRISTSRSSIVLDAWASSFARARAMLPCLPEVSVARRNMRRIILSLDQLQEHATRARRVDKHIAMTAGADLDLVGHQAHAALLQALDCSTQVRHTQANMMQPFAALGNELRNRRIF